MRKPIALACLTLSFSLLAPFAHGEWKMKQAPIMTEWAAKVDPKSPLPEYPRPQLERTDWQNLNGIWQFQFAKPDDALPVGTKLSDEILVPFPPESAISGVMEHHERMWYRRTFTVPAAWKGKQTILHFGAVDYEAEVFVNGHSVVLHRGGYDPFCVDITQYLQGDGEQELIVRAFDPTNNGGQPRGKQSIRPGGIMYTPTSGIWQTVWIEPVALDGIKNLKITPDVDGGSVKITVNQLGSQTGPVSIAVTDGGKAVATARGAAGSEIVIKVPDAKLWSPDSPHLYDLQVSTLGADDKPTDSVKSYFGMRKIALQKEGGFNKLFLNGKFVFQIGPLDQGFWPDGIYTQPTEEALKFDIQTTKDLGFNMIRKHIKVEPARWYYWTDKIGLLIWQDMPSANSYDDHPVPPVDRPEYQTELTRMVEGLYNVPSIVQWEVFNEGQGQHDTKQLVDLVKKLDPTRIVNQASGGNHDGVGDVYDIHPYPAPRAPEPDERHKNMALAVGEYGGIGRMVKGHLWSGTNGGYMNIDTPQELIDTYAEFTQLLKKYRDENGLSAAVYTQITDVETELNGLLTYDRIPKMDIKEIAKANHFELMPPTYKAIVPTSENESQTWQYTLEKPADGWFKTTFDAKSWKTGKGGFGTENTPHTGKIGTEWRTDNIWARRTFKLPNLSAEELGKLLLREYHDEGVEIYINGVQAFKAEGFVGNYENKPLTDEVRKALNPGADNVIALHCGQSTGGQYVDAGFSIREDKK